MKVCQIYNIASHYRAAIYSMIDRTYDCDMYCSKKYNDIKTIDYSLFRGNVKELRTLRWGNTSYQIGVPRLAFKKYDVYLATGDTWSISTWLFLLLSRVLNRRVFLWTHGLLGREKGIRKKLNVLFIKLATGAFIYSNRSKDLLISAGVSADKLYVIHNSLDYDTQIEIRSHIIPSTIFDNHFPFGSKTIIFIGRLTKVKRLDILIDALSLLNQSSKDYNLVLVGTGEDRSFLEEKVNELKLQDSVWFYGASYDEETNAELIYNADLCVAPGNIGLTAMHAMVYGTPCISNNDYDSQMPEHEAIIVDKTGDFFVKDSVDSLVETIKKWFENHIDREAVRKDCFEEIDTQWTPEFQINVIKVVFDDA